MRDDVRIAGNLKTVWQNTSNTTNSMKTAELIQALNKNDAASKKAGSETSGNAGDGGVENTDDQIGAKASKINTTK